MPEPTSNSSIKKPNGSVQRAELLGNRLYLYIIAWGTSIIRMGMNLWWLSTHMGLCMNLQGHLRTTSLELGMLLAIKKKITSVPEDMDKLEPFCPTGGNIKGYSHYEKEYLVLKNLNIELRYDPAILFLVITPKQMKT